MDGKFRIVVEVDPESREITIRDEAGNVRIVKGFMLFGGDAEGHAYYVFGWGASADAAWAYKEGFHRAFEDGDPGYENFYKQCACHIAQCLDPVAFYRQSRAEDVLARWDAEDQGKDTTH